MEHGPSQEALTQQVAYVREMGRVISAGRGGGFDFQRDHARPYLRHNVDLPPAILLDSSILASARRVMKGAAARRRCIY
jgi:hypothetical protein